MAFNKPISLNEQLDNTTKLFQIYMELDNTDKFCSESVQKGTFSPQTQAVIAQQLSGIAKKFEQMSAFPDQATYIKHVGDKLQSLQAKYSLGADPANTMSNVPHSLFMQKTGASAPSPALETQRPQENAPVSKATETQ